MCAFFVLSLWVSKAFGSVRSATKITLTLVIVAARCFSFTALSASGDVLSRLPQGARFHSYKYIYMKKQKPRNTLGVPDGAVARDWHVSGISDCRALTNASGNIEEY